MTSVTALLLVLTLTGAPVACVLCVIACQHEAAPFGHCGEDMATSDRPMMSASDSCDDRSIGDRPYVVEHRAAPGAAVLATTSFLTALEPAKTSAPAVPERAAETWLTPPLVLRI